MKIHISGATYNALQEFDVYETTSRGVIPIKGKGTMETYWLDRKDSQANENTVISHEQPNNMNSMTR